MDDQKHLAHRVFQLESHILDNEIHNTIDSLVDELAIPKLGEELKLIFKFYLFANHIKCNATTGMQVYNMKFYGTSHGNVSEILKEPEKYKLIMLAACNLTGSYIIKRYRKIEKLIENSYLNRLNASWLTLDNIFTLFKSLSIINFLMFLKVGKYPTIHERLLGIVPAMSDQDYHTSMSLNKVQMEFMYRETVWRAVAEFITTVIPLINIEQVKNRILRFTGLMQKATSDVKLSEKIHRESNDSMCAICGKQPFNPYVIGCRHVFCYYCLFSRHLSDPAEGYVCLLCRYNAKDQIDVHRYKIFELVK